jgi:hypothetical protein
MGLQGFQQPKTDKKQKIVAAFGMKFGEGTLSRSGEQGVIWLEDALRRTGKFFRIWAYCCIPVIFQPQICHRNPESGVSGGFSPLFLKK